MIDWVIVKGKSIGRRRGEQEVKRGQSKKVFGPIADISGSAHRLPKLDLVIKQKIGVNAIIITSHAKIIV